MKVLKAGLGWVGLGLAIIMGVILLVTLLFAPFIGMDILSNIKFCETQSVLMPELEFQWVLWGGCLMQIDDGTWVNANEYLNNWQRIELSGTILEK